MSLASLRIVEPARSSGDAWPHAAVRRMEASTHQSLSVAGVAEPVRRALVLVLVLVLPMRTFLTSCSVHFPRVRVES